MPVQVPARPRANGGTTTEAGTTISVFPSVSPPAFLSLGVGSALPQEYYAMNRRARKPQKKPGLCECTHAPYIPDISTLLLVVVCLVRIHASFLLRRGDGDVWVCVRCCGEAKVVDREPVTSPPVPAPSPWSDLGSVFGELHGVGADCRYVVGR
jgi:hypothetical protein